jgi:hypothetical protein
VGVEQLEDRLTPAALFSEFVDPHPAPLNEFGFAVVPLSTGNVVVTSPFDSGGGSGAGAVYLFNGSTGALISTLTGSTAGDQIGSGGVVVLASGNFVVLSPRWHNGAVVNAGAVTFGNGTTGVSGMVSAANSLVGSTASDSVGSSGTVTALLGGNYVVRSSLWDNGAVANVGAVTWGSGTTGVVGPISAANSLIGSQADDFVGSAVTTLPSGNYLVRSPSWANGAASLAGAVTFGNGMTGITGVVSAANSLVGSSANDEVGFGTAFVQVLTNGNYVVDTPTWDNGALADVGAVTWGSGTTGVVGPISAANSLIGSTAGDNVGNQGCTLLTNGNYVVRSPWWQLGGVQNFGAATWGNGATGTVGVVSAANSLIGSSFMDNVGGQNGIGGVAALSNGNYVVYSPQWDNGDIADVGAVTWGNGTTGTSGVISAANSLIGSTAGDAIGGSPFFFGPGGVTALPTGNNGNYVVVSPYWDNGAVVDAGAVTWVNGSGPITGVVSAANSLVGSTASDQIGSTGVVALTNGNYVVRSIFWHNGAIANAGAVTWGSGTAGVSGAVSAANSLVGSSAGDSVGATNAGSTGVVALTNGNYVVVSTLWSNGAVANVGAVTWGSGTTGVSGAVSAANSLVGSTFFDQVGSGGVTVLTNGNYVVRSPNWDNGAIVDAGAATWGSGTAGVTGAVSAANSLVGSTASDLVGGVTALRNGNYVVTSPSWTNGSVARAGAVTFGNGNTGVVGTISAANSLVGSTASDFVGIAVRVLPNGNYVVFSTRWHNGTLVNAGAVTFGNGNTGVRGTITPLNSGIGTTALGGLQVNTILAGQLPVPIVDNVNNTFFGLFRTEGGGHVRVGSQETGFFPNIAAPAAQTAYENVDQPIGGVSIGNGGSASLTFTLQVSHGTLTLGTTTNLTVTGNGSGSVTLIGTTADLNAALATLVYRGSHDYFGGDTLSLAAGDGFGSGLSASVALTVKSVADQAADLQARVRALQTAGVLNQGQANSLIVKLDNLQAAHTDKVLIGKVKAFLSEVAAYLSAGILTQAQADDLSYWGNILLLSVTRQ